MSSFDYTKYNYQELVAEVTRLIKEQGAWVDAYQSSNGQVLIQLVAAITDQLHYMLERRSQENFLPTAKLRTSIGAIANSMGYRPKRRTSATGTLQLTLLDNNGNPISSEGTIKIPKYTQVSFDKYNFVVESEQTLPSTTVYPVSFKVIEGLLKTQTFDSTDTTSTLYTDNYIVLSQYENIAEGSLYITTPTQTFYDVRTQVGGNPALESLSFASPTDESYDIRITNDGLRIIFGDGTYGEKPVGTLTVQWIESSGSAVAITDLNKSFIFPTSTLGDDVVKVPPNAYKYSLKNTTTITGGLDAETVSLTKNRAPDYIRTAARAVTKHDYKFWAKQSGVGGIVDATAYGEEEIGIDVLNMNNVYLVYLRSDGSAWTTTQQQEFRDFMDQYKGLTTHLVLIPAEIIPLQINMTMKRSSLLSASNSEVYNFLKTDLSQFLAYAEGSLAKSVYHSELVDRYHSLTMTKDGVTKRIADYVKIDVKALKPFTTPLSTQSTTATITAGSTGNVYSIVINGTTYSYTQVGGDTANSIATSLAALVDANSAVSATANANVITIATTITATPFTITNTGTTVPLNNRINVTINLPVSKLKNPDNLQLFLPGSIQIIQTNGTVIATDDGAGNIANGTVNYITGVMTIPIITNGSYYVRYQQSQNQNVITTEKQAPTYSLPKTNYTDATNLLSTITFE